MKARHTLSLALLLAGTVTAFGQNLNPTVEVTNTYQREAGGIEKPVLLLPVPVLFPWILPSIPRLQSR